MHYYSYVYIHIYIHILVGPVRVGRVGPVKIFDSGG